MSSHGSLFAQGVLLLALSQCGVSTQCSSYLQTSVAEMRQATGSGCFELERVVVTARTPSTSTPRVYVQDLRGGPYSAIRAKCDASATHACPEQTARNVESLLDGSEVTIRGYYLQGSLSGFEEIYLDDVRDEQTLAAVPTPAKVSLTDMSRDGRARSQWFQIVQAEISPQDPLVMYDFSPAEFARGGTCPSWGGFALISASLAATGTADGCSSNGNPIGLAKPDGREVLIGREFYKEFFASTDCSCAAASKQHLLSTSSTVVGSISGILTPEIKAGSSSIYQVFHPLSKADFPIAGG
jgi:hypothetical protein